MPKFKLVDNSKVVALQLNTPMGQALTFLKDRPTEVDDSTANQLRDNPELVEVFVDGLGLPVHPPKLTGTPANPPKKPTPSEKHTPTKKGRGKRRY